MHLAKHGFFDPKAPALSGLLFYHNDSTEDEILFVNEAYNLPNQAQLITLSACETARGEYYSGEGLMDLGQGLMYSGAQNLLISLWKVSDSSTPKLMSAFYKNVLAEKTLPEALK
jgi:CHAT domain-containing protein